ncbi:MAG: 50S ribosomal protein L24 [Candidatus Omnitrophica bacterium]|nr:50S ribosomal protein L24 [Candidatus Omnitrophota bacterium]
MKIRKNDNVKVLAGKDKGKTGKVLKIIPAKNKAIVEGVNFIKKHARKSQENPQGSIVQKERPVSVSSLAVICTRCNKSTRIGHSKLTDGNKVRFCKICKETI